ncbi:hypothetical protein HYV50_00645 [Candidatus Pacearchaeota archaeon]|nr:hypothetical protein [Candidatus Pacearchaeota archaeon]
MKKEGFIILLLAIGVFFILLFLFYYNLDNFKKGKFTGKATSESVGLNITVVGSIPTLTIEKPRNETYFNNQSLRLKITSNGNNFWYNLDNNANTTFNGDTYFNTSEGAHTIYVFANNSAGITKKNVSFFVNFMIYNISFSNFIGAYAGNSTNFRELSYEEMQNLSNVILENTLFGGMRFIDIINMTADFNMHDNFTDIDSFINVSFNRIELNSSGLPNFNKSAVLTIRNLSLANPRIARDGVVCPSTICKIISYSSGTLTFNVTGFSIYSAEETPGVSLSPSGGGGGGGGTIGVVKSIGKELSIDKEEIKVSLKQGETKREQFIIENTGEDELKIWINTSSLNEFLVVKLTQFTLRPNEKIVVFVDFFAPETTNPDLYLGKIFVSSGEIKKEILVSLEVESKKPLFDVEVEILKKDLSFEPGEEIIANIKIFNLGEIGRVDVGVRYVIKDGEGNVIIEELKTTAVETQINFVKTITIPEDAKPGKYVFYTKVEYNGGASATTLFTIKKKSLDFVIYYIAGAIILIILTVVIFYLIHRLIHKEVEFAMTEKKDHERDQNFKREGNL